MAQPATPNGCGEQPLRTNGQGCCDRRTGRPPWKKQGNALKFGSIGQLQLQTMKTAFASLAPEVERTPVPSFHQNWDGWDERQGQLLSVFRWKPPAPEGHASPEESFLATTISLSRVFPLLPRPLASADHTVNFRKYGGYWARLPSGIERQPQLCLLRTPRATRKDRTL